MPFSHHSHSGQFCHHAKDTLEAMVQAAIAKGMRVFALTEHMPRDQVEDLYPEEVEAQKTPFDLFQSFDAYYNTAVLLRGKYSHMIKLLVGFEAEYVRASSMGIIDDLRQIYRFDFCVGSVHHVDAIPIDFDRRMYLRALEAVSPGVGDEAVLFRRYFDIQFEMLTSLKPAVVGHFDLIRLMAKAPQREVRDYGDEVWSAVMRNLEFVKSYGGLMELSSASLRKGWKTPYPGRDVCEAFITLKGRFTLSDDSHNVSQVGLNYKRLLGFIKDLGLKEVFYLEKLPMGEIAVDVLDACAVRQVTIEELEADPFWEGV